MISISGQLRSQSVAVVGAGIVGMSAALHLQRDGHAVTVIDGRAPGAATSFGNAGGIVTGGVTPTSTPALWRELPAMLLDRTHPVRLRWSYLPRLAPWLARFLLAARRVEAIAAALQPIVTRAYDAHRELAELTGVPDLLRPVGWLKLYETEAGFAGSSLERALMAAQGIRFEVLGADEIRQLEPNLAPRFVRGLFQPDSAFVSQPHRLVEGYARHFVAAGGCLLQDRVRSLEPLAGGGVRVRAELGIHQFDRVVLAAGAWSRDLAAGIGDHISLDTERGYHLNLDPAGTGELRRPVVFPERKFVLAPMRDGIRLTSGIELAGLDAPPDFRAIYRLLPHARQALPGLGDHVTREWMGYRPSTPDSVPVIGASPRTAAIVYAFGHGHLGLTLGPITGRLVADLVAGRPPFLDVTPYSAARF